MTVAIVGLGIAGMRAAMLLEAAGHDVLLFEARDRLGGRMQTIDFGDGTKFESGGEWIDSDHERVFTLLHELGIDSESSHGERLYVVHGESCLESQLWNGALEDQLRFEASAGELARELRQPAWANVEVPQLDIATLSQFIDQNAHTPEGRWLLTATALSDEGDDPDQISLLGWLVFYQKYMQRQGGEMSSARIAGGAAALFEKMSANLRTETRFEHELVRVTQNSDNVVLEFSNGSTALADHAILTVPPRPLERVVFEPALSAAVRCAIEGCLMAPILKICLAFDRAWWTDKGWNGGMQCDLPIQQTWDATRGETPVLACYVCGRAARSLGLEPDAVERALADLTQIHPEAKEHFLRGWVYDWSRDPYCEGGFSCVAPGYVLKHMGHIARAEGRVHFAGEHTSAWTGFIEGALESAERAVQEVQGADQ
ncbi:NAD(P)/FAD-dependent oxidoreductase [soil metagenome]